MEFLKHFIEESPDLNPQGCTKRSTNTIEKNNQNIEVAVVFGMPARDCAYHGICSINQRKGSTEIKARCLSIANIFPVGKTHLLFQFYKNNMTKLIMKRHFGSGYFIVLEDYQIPEFVGEVIGQCTTVIRQGIYPVVDKDKYFEVLFGPA